MVVGEGAARSPAAYRITHTPTYTLRVALPCPPPQAGAIKHGPEGLEAPPDAWVAHLPGHYEILYACVPLDVEAGAVVPLVTPGAAAAW